jgi:hypothetical protein
MISITRLVLCTCAAFSVASAECAVITFPFDSVPTGLYFPGSVSTSIEDLTITVSPNGVNDGFVDVYAANDPAEVAIMGNRRLATNLSNITYSPTPARFTFSLPINRVDFGFYDNGGDDDGDVLVNAYSSSDMLLAGFVFPYGTAFGGTSGLLSVPTGTRYFTLSTTGVGNSNSMEYSLRSVEVVPEPSSLLLLIISSLIIATRRNQE